MSGRPLSPCPRCEYDSRLSTDNYCGGCGKALHWRAFLAQLWYWMRRDRRWILLKRLVFGFSKRELEIIRPRMTEGR